MCWTIVFGLKSERRSKMLKMNRNRNNIIIWTSDSVIRGWHDVWNIYGALSVLQNINLLLNINAMPIMMWPYKRPSFAYSEHILHDEKQINKPIRNGFGISECVRCSTTEPLPFTFFSMTIYNLYILSVVSRQSSVVNLVFNFVLCAMFL